MVNLSRLKTTSPGDIQVDSGVVLYNFNPDSPTVPSDEDIVCATTGGINVSCVPTHSDFGEDIDNCKGKLKEFQNLDYWDCKFSFTALDITEETLKLALGACTTTGNKTTLDSSLKNSHFKDIWWAGNLKSGKFFAICLKNALSTGGFTLQTTKNGKGQVSVELTGYVSIEAQDEMPMEFYIEQDADMLKEKMDISKTSEVKA